MNSNNNILIWGTGAARLIVLDSLIKHKCNVIGYVDNNPKVIDTVIDGVRVYSLENAIAMNGYIIASIKEYDTVIYQYKRLKTNTDGLICFFSESDYNAYSNMEFINAEKWENCLLKEKLHKYEIRLKNAKYETEAADKLPYPQIARNEEALHRIINQGASFIRFGDGEFEIMAGKNRAPFQSFNLYLSNRLKDIVKVEDEKLLIGIANNYGNLERYTEMIADDIREYMSDEVRGYHYSILNMNKTYYDAYIFKAYLPYKDKENTIKRIAAIKKIWEQRDIVLVEGDKTRTGYGNDLLDNAKSIQRILAPTKNAFARYDEILSVAKKIPKDKLILIVLGPAGKVLGFDLYKEGYQIIDIGQIDMDYDWFLAGAGCRVGNKYKYVSQLAEREILDIDDPVYNGQIIDKIL